MIAHSSAAAVYRTAFGAPPAVTAAAPGRVNLIGEHTDYNEGLVLPAAIDRGVAVAAGPGEPGTLSILSAGRGAPVTLATDHPLDTVPAPWLRYPAGVYHLLVPPALHRHGIRLALDTDLPEGAGLSSSAALETASCLAIASLLDLPLTDEECITLCHRAEQECVGVHCGIMDQTVTLRAQAGHALFLDCRSLTVQQIPFPEELEILICHSGVQRSLLASPYNTRREECTAAVRILRSDRPALTALRDISMEELPSVMRSLPPPLHRRVRHVVTENCRVMETVTAIRNRALPRFGKMLYDSHMSLRDQYDAGCPEVDAIVDICAEHEGVVGARMTGAGFGGAAIAVVERGAAPGLVRRLETGYPAATGRTPLILRSTPAGGATVRRL
jgi:galactokinase